MFSYILRCVKHILSFFAKCKYMPQGDSLVVMQMICAISIHLCFYCFVQSNTYRRKCNVKCVAARKYKYSHLYAFNFIIS